MERWHPIPEGTVGALGLDQPKWGLISHRAVPDPCQEGSVPAARTYSLLLRAELLGWSTGAPCAQRLCPTDLQPFSAQCHVPSTTVRRHLPLPGPKGILQEPHKGAKGDLPGGEFSITSA